MSTPWAALCRATKSYVDSTNVHTCVKEAGHTSDLGDMEVHRCACWHVWTADPAETLAGPEEEGHETP